jgi:hypothetical protein
VASREAKVALFDEFARVGKALASGRRIELLDVLANGERTVEALAGEAACRSPIPASTCRFCARPGW